MKLYYHRDARGIRNFGDDLNEWLWRKIFPVVFDDSPDVLFVGIGTLLNTGLPRAKKTIVFGTGVGYGSPPIIDDSWHIYCLRGPLSAKALGVPLDKAVTDGAVLVSQVFSSDHKKKYRFSFLPHMLQAHNSSSAWMRLCESLDIKFIDPRWNPLDVLQEIDASEFLITESLHGAIIADTFRVPWVPVKSHETILDFKWYDWCGSVGLGYCPVKILPFWDKRGVVDLSARIRKEIKSRIVAYQFNKIIKKHKLFLSKKETQAILIDELQRRGRLFLEDYKKGYFRD